MGTQEGTRHGTRTNKARGQGGLGNTGTRPFRGLPRGQNAKSQVQYKGPVQGKGTEISKIMGWGRGLQGWGWGNGAGGMFEWEGTRQGRRGQGGQAMFK